MSDDGTNLRATEQRRRLSMCMGPATSRLLMTSSAPGTRTCSATTWAAHPHGLLRRPATPTPGAIGADACTLEEALAALVSRRRGRGPRRSAARDAADLLAGLTPQGQRLALGLSMSIAAQAASRPPTVAEARPPAPAAVAAPPAAATAAAAAVSPTPTPTSSPTAGAHPPAAASGPERGGRAGGGGQP